ncbi:MAG: hypothetical protein R3190_10310, partial [Thermoanaerobaculia bacterium]|nr:hypothetical protein [Thermoanaerobaculia bacterium]
MGLGKIRKRARTVRDGLAARLVASGLDPRPVSEWVGFLRDHPESRYQRLPGLVRRRCGRLDAKDSGLESLLVRWLLAALAVELRAEDYRLRLPASCASLLPMQVERVLDQIEGLDPSVYRLHREEVAKDLGLLTGRLVCVGYHFIEVSTKPRRKVLFAGGLRQWLRVM